MKSVAPKHSTELTPSFPQIYTRGLYVTSLFNFCMLFKSSPTCGAEFLILNHHIRERLPTSAYQEESLQPFFC